MSNQCHFGRKGSKLIIGTVCVCFWITVTMCYYAVHHYDQKQDSSMSIGKVLRRETRDGDHANDAVRQEKTGRKRETEGGQEGLQVEPAGDKDAGLHDDIISMKENVKVAIFPPCKNDTEKYFFDPSVLKNGDKLRRFTGRKIVPYVSVYPSDGTSNLNKRKKDGNTVISKKVLDTLRENFKATAKESPFQHGNILRVERLTMPDNLSHGGRLFLLEIASVDQGTFTYHKEYVIDSGQNDDLCHPHDYVIDSTRKVYVIVTVKNLGEWVARLIKEFEQLQEKSGDGNFELILADFNSTDMDLVQLVKASMLRSKIKLLNLANKYNKAAGVVAAVDLVQNSSDIVFLCDLHLEIPTMFLSDIREHVIQNQMVFTPVVGKLESGATAEHPRGEWDTNGFGVIAMTKSDWDMIGGINKAEFNGNQWGGEDWEMIDRILESGLIVNRRRVPGLLHHYHTKTGMWPGGRYQLVGGGRGGGAAGGGAAGTGNHKNSSLKTDSPKNRKEHHRVQNIRLSL